MPRFLISRMDRLFKVFKSLLEAHPTRTLCSKLTHDSATVGSSVRIQGILSESRGNQDVEMHANEVTVLGQSQGEPNVPHRLTKLIKSYSQSNPEEFIQRIICEYINIYDLEQLTWRASSDFALTSSPQSIDSSIRNTFITPIRQL